MRVPGQTERYSENFSQKKKEEEEEKEERKEEDKGKGKGRRVEGKLGRWVGDWDRLSDKTHQFMPRCQTAEEEKDTKALVSSLKAEPTTLHQELKVLLLDSTF